MSNIFRSDSEINKIKESKEFKKVAKDKGVNEFLNNPQFQELKERYEGRSEDEILHDAKDISKRLKEQYGEEEYNKKLNDLKNIERFLSSEQKRKMRKFLENLE